MYIYNHFYNNDKDNLINDRLNISEIFQTSIINYKRNIHQGIFIQHYHIIKYSQKIIKNNNKIDTKNIYNETTNIDNEYKLYSRIINLHFCVLNLKTYRRNNNNDNNK